MHTTAHKLREAIAQKRPVLGTFLVEFAGPTVVNVLADAGFDFVLVDCEHGNLSVDLGVPGQWNSPLLQSAIQKVSDACRKHGKIMACHADRIEDMPTLRERGVQMFGYFCDIGLFKASAAAVAADFRKTLEGRA